MCPREYNKPRLLEDLPFTGNRYNIIKMILSFRCADTQALFVSGKSQRFANIKSVAERKLIQLHAAISIESLRAPPGNRLEALTRERRGQHSIRINDQWRLCFEWTDDGALNVEIVDYHR